MAQPVGFCYLKDEVQKTDYHFGNISELKGKLLKVLERNKENDCLCITEKGLIDVSACDIRVYLPWNGLPDRGL